MHGKAVLIPATFVQRHTGFQTLYRHSCRTCMLTDQPSAFVLSSKTNVNVLLDGGLENIMEHIIVHYTPASGQFRVSALTCN